MTKPNCDCPQAIDLDTDQAIDAFINGSLRAGTALAGMAMKAGNPDSRIGYPNMDGWSDRPSPEGPPIRQGVGAGRGSRQEGVPAGRTTSSTGGSTSEMANEYSNPRPTYPATLDEVATGIKSLNDKMAFILNAIRKAAEDDEDDEDDEDVEISVNQVEETEDDEEETAKASRKARKIASLKRKLAALTDDEGEYEATTQAGRDEGLQAQDRWADKARPGLDKVLRGEAMYHGSAANLMSALRGNFNPGGAKAEALFKSNPAGYILAKARAADAAREVGSWTLEDDMSLESVTACAKAVQHGSCDSHILNLRLRSATEAVRTLLAVTDLLA